MKKAVSTLFILILVYACVKKVIPLEEPQETQQNNIQQNSVMFIGGTGWSFGTCVTNGSVFTGSLNGTSTKVNLSFGIPILPLGGQTFSLTSAVPTGSLCRLTIMDPVGQATNTTWYSQGGLVTVTNNTTTQAAFFNCSFDSVKCVQQGTVFPVVTAVGYVVCQ